MILKLLKHNIRQPYLWSDNAGGMTETEYNGMTVCRPDCGKYEEGSRKDRCMWLWEDDVHCQNLEIKESTLRRLKADRIR